MVILLSCLLLSFGFLVVLFHRLLLARAFGC